MQATLTEHISLFRRNITGNRRQTDFLAKLQGPGALVEKGIDAPLTEVPLLGDFRKNFTAGVDPDSKMTTSAFGSLARIACPVANPEIPAPTIAVFTCASASDNIDSKY